jgi:methionyl aminopeptidase
MRLKSKEDIEKIRKSGRVLAQTHELLQKYAKPGMTTFELDELAREFIREKGGEPAFLHVPGYPASICASVNEVVIHGIPNKKILHEGDILSVDIGVILDGYYSDAAQTHAIGNISSEAQKLLKVTEECLHKAIEAAVLGNRVRDISKAVFDHAQSFGYGVVFEFVGHGVGFALHEEPQVPNYIARGPSPRLRKGMVIAIEPMINIGVPDVEVLDDDWTVVTEDGKLSAHFEHTVAVTDGKADILTL